ncbi:MAG: right-handed parallel beta-helix repeat-containing protein [Kiritimatiellales bacterium]|nr:right-handed parallel beta-helix repeat-containing protein [Kiritimatiellales bacterium]
MKIGSLIFGVVCVAGVVFGQGGLTPPGAPAPTMKTLDEISAAIAGTAHAAGQVESRIDVETLAGDGSSRHLVVVPGSYYLSSNLVVSNMNAIAVGCSGVTLDLNGFSIMQLASGTGEGVNISAVASGVSVRNGSIHNFNHGILGAGSNNCFKTLSFFYNLAGLASGPSSRMINCHAYHNNGVYGINAGEGSVLSGCSAYYSGGKGIQTADDCTLDRCLSYNNNGGGIYVGVGCSLNACSAKDNVGFGIRTSTDCVLKSCMATENGGAGFTGGAANAFSDCAALDNTGTGFNVAQVCRLKDCVAKGNQGNGINALFGANLSGCNASDNHGAYGICVGLASRVARCNASENSSSTTAESTRTKAVCCSVVPPAGTQTTAIRRSGFVRPGRPPFKTAP